MTRLTHRSHADGNRRHMRAASAPISPKDLAKALALKDENSTQESSLKVPTSINVPSIGQDNLSELQMVLPTIEHLDITHPAKWAITFQELERVDDQARKLYGRIRYRTKTMRDINKDIISPKCQETNTCYALAANPKGHRIDAFITHCWDEPFHDFVSSIRAAFHHFPDKPNLWICAFALVQGSREIVAEQLELPLEEVPFVRALREAKWFVVVRNSQRDLYSRIWCVCELCFAIECGFNPMTGTGRQDQEVDCKGEGYSDIENPGKNVTGTMVIGPDVFSKSRTSCVDATASDPRDKAKILQMLWERHTVETVDRLVLQYRQYGEQPKESHTKSWRSAINLLLLALLAAVLVIMIVLAASIRGNHSDASSPPRATERPPPSTGTAPSSSALASCLDTVEEDLDFSPQFRAGQWILRDLNLAATEQWQQCQLFALATFFYAYRGQFWDPERKRIWMNLDLNECSWTGVTCAGGNRVTGTRPGTSRAAVHPHKSVFLGR